MANAATKDKGLASGFDGEEPTQGQLVPVTNDELKSALLANVDGVAKEITESMLSAEDLDALLSSTDGTAVLVGLTFVVRAWKFLRSNIKGGSGFYAVMNVTTLDGKERVVTSGSQNILAALVWFGEKKLEQSPPLTCRHSVTEAGNDVYRFAKAVGA